MSVLLERGSIFAREFRVGRPIGEGGMGAVYVATQLATGSPRALKVMHPQLAADERMQQRFVLEARACARIKSDHVVQVVAAGIEEVGEARRVPWLAMELLEGCDLAAALKQRGAFPIDDVVEVMDQLAHALGAAHDVGIVHRDLKPENVFLCAPRRAGVSFTIKVLDFGIAKLLAEASTQITAAVGTPLWMAPEQAESSEGVVPATDVWAMGLLAYRLLTGRHYWRGAEGPSPSPMAILREVVLGAIEPASRRAARVDRADRLPGGFDGWFARCVERDPRMRFRDARRAGAEFVALFGDRHATLRASRTSSILAQSARFLAVAEPIYPVDPVETEIAHTELAGFDRHAPAETEPWNDAGVREHTTPSGLAPAEATLPTGRPSHEPIEPFTSPLSEVAERRDVRERPVARSIALGGAVALVAWLVVAACFALVVQPRREARAHVASADQMSDSDDPEQWDRADRELSLARARLGDDPDIERIEAIIERNRAVLRARIVEERAAFEARLKRLESELRAAEKELASAKTETEILAAQAKIAAVKAQVAAPAKPLKEPCCVPEIICDCS
jgi:serine/threonine protein kinase